METVGAEAGAGRAAEGRRGPEPAPAPPAAPDPGADPAVIFEPLHVDVVPPSRSTELSAGHDLRAYLRGRAVRVRRSGSEGVEEVRSGTDGERGAAAPSLTLLPGDRALVPTGFRARLPAGYEAQIRIRSSVAWRKGLVVPNAPGTVDADYPDEWFVLVQNASDRPQRIEHGERIAQVVIARHATLPWREGTVERSTDRTGGLGSTGR